MGGSLGRAQMETDKAFEAQRDTEEATEKGILDEQRESEEAFERETEEEIERGSQLRLAQWETGTEEALKRVRMQLERRFDWLGHRPYMSAFSPIPVRQPHFAERGYRLYVSDFPPAQVRQPHFAERVRMHRERLFAERENMWGWWPKQKTGNSANGKRTSSRKKGRGNRQPWLGSEDDSDHFRDDDSRDDDSRDDDSRDDFSRDGSGIDLNQKLTVIAYGKHQRDDSGRKMADVHVHISCQQNVGFSENRFCGEEVLCKTTITVDTTTDNQLHVRLRPVGRDASSWTHILHTDEGNHSGEQHFDLPRDSTGRLKQPITVNWKLKSVPNSNPGHLLRCAVDISQVVGDTTPTWSNNSISEKNTRFPLEIPQRVPRNVTMIKDGLPPEKPDVSQVHSEVITMATPRTQFKKWGCHGDDPSRVRSLLPVRCGQSVGAPPCFHGNHLAVM